MSDVLDSIAGLKPEEILARGSDEYVTVDIFSLAKELGINVYPVDFSALENDIGCEQNSILGAVADNGQANYLAVLLKDSLGDDDYYKNKSLKEKETILRRRQRFTLAHEIAHACLHLSNDNRKYKVDFRTQLNSFFEETAENPKEYAANVFAGKLLIPRERIEIVCQGLVYNSLNALCDIFDVSHSVMRARLKYLGIDFVDDSKDDVTV